jgi:hypothetical protein
VQGVSAYSVNRVIGMLDNGRRILMLRCRSKRVESLPSVSTPFLQEDLPMSKARDTKKDEKKKSKKTPKEKKQEKRDKKKK